MLPEENTTMSLSMTRAMHPAALPSAALGHGPKTALAVVLAFALIAAACTALGLATAGGATGGAADPDCLGACWERVV
jgi:hypothetical protein